MRLTLLLAAAALSAGWAVYGWLALQGARRMRFLSAMLAAPGTPAPDGPPPSLSVVVTARDEAGAIEGTVRSLLGQRHPALEILVVDDRSTDGTAAILDRLAAEAGPRLRVIHVASLPEGWLGKCHACHVGAARATGTWILFMDADVTLGGDDLLARTTLLAERLGIDHLPVLPDMRPVGVLQGALLAAFEQALLFHMRFWEMEADRPRGGAGVGAFNLVRRAAYDRVGGHTLLRLEVAEDYKLGMLLKESGARQRLWSGFGLIFCPWHRGAGAVVRGLEKNFFGGTGYSIATVAWQSLALFVLQAGPAALLLAGLPWPFLVQQGALLLMLRSASRRLGRSPLALWIAFPAAFLLLLFAYWNSTVRTLRRGGILWRDTFYPIATLRRGVIRPGDWARLSGRGASAPLGGAGAPLNGAGL
jgi:cellulose synthase/poly-beta-1,6-N-acetylglucosamine synthase-like glycosyltransferase